MRKNNKSIKVAHNKYLFNTREGSNGRIREQKLQKTGRKEIAKQKT